MAPNGAQRLVLRPFLILGFGVVDEARESLAPTKTKGLAGLVHYPKFECGQSTRVLKHGFLAGRKHFFG